MAKCNLCNKRKGKRFCKGLRQWICAECCGEKRFNLINCPDDCVYLEQAKEYSIGRVIEIIPNLNSDQWKLHFNIEFLTYKFLSDFPNFTDEEYKEVISLFEKEYSARQGGFFLPALMPKSSRALKLKTIIQEFLNDVEKEKNEFGLNKITPKEILEVFSWERERVEEYINKNKNLGPNLFLKFLKRYISNTLSKLSQQP